MTVYLVTRRDWPYFGNEKCRSRVIHINTRTEICLCKRGRRRGSKSLLSFRLNRGHARVAFLDLITRMLRAVYYALLLSSPSWRSGLPRTTGGIHLFIKGTVGLYIAQSRDFAREEPYSFPVQLFLIAAISLSGSGLTNTFQVMNVPFV